MRKDAVMTNRLPVLEILLAGIETFGCHLLFFFLLLLLNAVLPFSPFSSAPLLFALMLLLLALCTLRIFTGLGKDSAHHHKAPCSPARLLFFSAPVFLFVLGFEALLMFVFRTAFTGIGYGIFALTVCLCGGTRSDAFAESELPESFAPCWLICAAIFLCAFCVTAYFSYRHGIKRREAERRALLLGDTVFMEKEARRDSTPRAKKYMWIPLVNYIPLFPWLFAYYLYPEYKLRRFFPRALLFIAAVAAANRLIEAASNIFPYPAVSYSLSAVKFYFIGVLICAVILDDEKKTGLKF